MRKEEYMITLFHIKEKFEKQQKVSVLIDEEKNIFFIYSILENKEVQVQGITYFSVYQLFRDKLLNMGYGIKCNGPKINAVQSAMMGNINKIYLVELKKHAQRKDVVDIWAYADIDKFPNSNERKEFFDKWVNSL